MRSFLIGALVAVVAGGLLASGIERHTHARTLLGPTTAATGTSCPAAVFNGSTAFATTGALSGLGSVTHFSISVWATFPSLGNTDGLLMETSSNAGSSSNDGSFFINPNSSAPSGVFAMLVNDALPSTSSTASFARPSTGAWHHYLFVTDMTISNPSGNQTAPIYLDGVSQALTQGGPSDGTHTLLGYQLFIMSRNGTALFNSGNVQNVAIWNATLTGANATSLAGGASPNSITPAPLYYWRLTGSTGTEANLGTGGTNSVTLTNVTSTAAGPSPCPTQ